MARTNQAAAPATLVSFLASVMPVAGMLIMLAASGEFAAPEAALALLVLTIRASAPIDELALAGVSLNEVRSHSSAYHTAAMAPRLPAPADPVPPAGSEIELRDVAHPPALRTITANIPQAHASTSQAQRCRQEYPSGTVAALRRSRRWNCHSRRGLTRRT